MKIVIIEDHRMFREVVRQVCVDEMGHDVVGESASGAVGIELSMRLNPDLLILDLGLPDMDGFEVAKTIRAVRPDIRILILSCQLHDYTVVQIEKLAVHGFLDKATNTVQAIHTALNAIAAGKTYFSSEFLRLQRARKNDTQSFDKILSDAEQDVLRLVGKGLSDEEIGCRLQIAPATAQTHRSRLLKKLGIKSTPKLILFAQKTGFAFTISRPSFPA